MAKTKLLNLDTLADEELIVVLGGKEHKLKEMSVADFIWAQQNLKSVSQKSDEVEIMESMIGMFLRQFPTMERKDLESLPLQKLNQMAEFVQSFGMKGAEKAVEEAEKSSKGETVPTAAVQS
jgi:hypothetical protein